MIDKDFPTKMFASNRIVAGMVGGVGSNTDPVDSIHVVVVDTIADSKKVFGSKLK